MASGVPLTDEDRWPWLARVAEGVSERCAGAPGKSVVLCCSALRRAYRDYLRQHIQQHALVFVHLDVDVAELRRRVSAREKAPGQVHFMPATLLDSQLATLEVDPQEAGVVRVPVPDEEPADATAARVMRCLLVSPRHREVAQQ